MNKYNLGPEGDYGRSDVGAEIDQLHDTINILARERITILNAISSGGKMVAVALGLISLNFVIDFARVLL